MLKENLIKSTIPNSLTMLRCLTALLLPLIVIYGGELGAIIATPLLILAGITDYFDGFYARKYKVISNFGKILDPIADKLLVIGLLFALASEHMFEYYFSFIPALIIVLREILISGIRESISGYKISLEVTLLAKWKTTIQLFACGSFLVWRTNTFSYNFDALGIISYTFLWIAAIITLITGIQYIVKIVLFFKNNKNKS
jgi:cardiolipin synthase